MTDHLTSSTDGPETRPETITPARRLEAPPPSTVETHNDLEKLAQSEIMLQTAIEALSPDADEIQKRLDREEDRAASETDRHLSFRLVVVAVVLVFLILALDLLLAGV